jgi:hypothetical protein
MSDFKELSVVQDLMRLDKTLTEEQKRRLKKYKENIDAIEGYHFEKKGVLGEDEEVGAEVTINYVRRFIDKLVRFTLGDKGFSIDAEDQELQDENIIPYLNEIWDKNRRKTLATSLLKWGSGLGDVYVALEPSKRMLVEILRKNNKAKDAKKVEESLTVEEYLEPDFLIKVIPAPNGFPYYREDKRTPFSEMVLFEHKEIREKPKKDIQKAYKTKSYNERKFLEFADYLEERSKLPREEGIAGETSEYIYKKVYYADRIEEYVGDKIVETYKLNYGIVPIVHIPNKIKSSNTPYGDDDITDLIPLNYELNYKASDVSEIINYYQSPLTLFFGVGLDSIEKGSDRMLTGLPESAKVQNLEMQSDLSASNSYIDFLKNSMLEVFGITPNALTGTSNISNTSGVALHMQYEPLMERKQEKTTYLDGLAKVNTYLIYLGIFYGRIKGVTGDVRELLATKPKLFQTTVTFPNTLPKDELMIIQKGNSKIQAGIGTREDILRELGETNPQKKLKEVEQDQLSVLRLELIKSLMANIVDDGVSPQAFDNVKRAFGSGQEGKGEKDFATGFLNDPMITALIAMNHKSVDEEKNDIEQAKVNQEMESRTGTKEVKQARGRTQSIV